MPPGSRWCEVGVVTAHSPGGPVAPGPGPNAEKWNRDIRAGQGVAVRDHQATVPGRSAGPASGLPRSRIPDLPPLKIRRCASSWLTKSRLASPTSLVELRVLGLPLIALGLCRAPGHHAGPTIPK